MTCRTFRLNLGPGSVWSAKHRSDLRMAVVRKAKEHEIDLKPTQVMVQRTRSGDSTTIYLAADKHRDHKTSRLLLPPCVSHHRPEGSSIPRDKLD